MKVVFRIFPEIDAVEPAEGEIHIRHPVPESRRNLATLVLGCGLQAFPRGPGELDTIVVSAEPTFDDMLAATFVLRLLEGQDLPAGGKAFAQYAALVRDGLRPSQLPLEVSLEGIYLAIRQEFGDELAQPTIGARFLVAWQRMAERILQAAETDQDPFTESLFATGPEFARERALLTRDQEIYHHDVARGEQWQVALPGGPPRGSALLLRQPKSLFFKDWCRHDPKAPTDATYVLLAVNNGRGKWVFSTNPVQRLELKDLADRLQAEEHAADPARAEKDPWFDGAPFAHTLIAAPSQGTLLPDKKVLQIVKRWARVRSKSPWRKKAGYLATAACLLLTLGTLAFWTMRAPAPVIGEPLKRSGFKETQWKGAKALQPGKLFLYGVGVARYQDSRLKLDFPDKDVEALAQTFTKHSQGMFAGVVSKVLTNESATRETILEDLTLLKNQVAENNLVIVTFSGHGAHLSEEDFYFLPFDFNARKKASSGVYWNQVRTWLEQMPCHVIVIMDTCQSGTISRALSVNTAAKGDKALVVIAACLNGEDAQEWKQWGHGALTLAILEGITGQYLYAAKTETQFPQGYGPGKRVSLHDLRYYVPRRVRELVGGDQNQNPVVNNSGNLNEQTVFVAVLPGH